MILLYYIVGFAISVVILHIFKKPFGINYPNKDSHIDSNESAILIFSILWPFTSIVISLYSLYKLLELYVILIGKLIKKFK